MLLSGATGFPFFPHPHNTSERRRKRWSAGRVLRGTWGIPLPPQDRVKSERREKKVLRLALPGYLNRKKETLRRSPASLEISR
jgi:hypothetical protein